MTGRLIVHADDFGLCEEVNEGIAKAHVDGVLTSTSIMANGSRFDEAVTLARSLPDLDVGVHLTLVDECPISEPGRVPSLVDGAGRFPPDAAAMTARSLRGALDVDELRAELDAQIRRVLAAGIEITHVDSHQHVHALPVVRRVVLSLAREHGIEHVRRPVSPLETYMLARPAEWPRVARMLALNAFCLAGSWGDRVDDRRFVGFHEGGRLDEKALGQVIDHLPSSGVTELMCHPGIRRSTDRYARWDYDWPGELHALVAPRTRERLHERGVELVSYRTLP